MVDSVVVFTASLVTTAELHQEVVRMGGELMHSGFVLSDGEAAVWPAIDETGLDPDDPSLFVTMGAMVGAPIRSCVTLDLCSNPGSRRLAGRFLESFAERHPFVVDASSCCTRLLTPGQALSVLREDRSVFQGCPVHGSVLDRIGPRRRRWWPLR